MARNSEPASAGAAPRSRRQKKTGAPSRESAAELLNTALEHLADRLHPEQHPTIQAAKDCAAAAVLVASLAAVLIGLLTLAVGLHLLDRA